jgi:hypothetical protein
MKMYRHRKWKKTKMTYNNTKKNKENQRRTEIIKAMKMRPGELYMRGSDGWMEGGEGCRETA